MQSEAEEILTVENGDFAGEYSNMWDFSGEYISKVTDCNEKSTHTHSRFLAELIYKMLNGPRTAHFLHFKVTLLEKRLGST